MSRASLIHYDTMMESEKSVVSESLNAAVQKAGAERPWAPDVGDDEPTQGDAEEPEEYERAFEIKEILEQRMVRNKKEFKVRWKPCRENRFSATEATWESESSLKEDGRSRMLAAWCKRQLGVPRPRRNAV